MPETKLYRVKFTETITYVVEFESDQPVLGTEDDPDGLWFEEMDKHAIYDGDWQTQAPCAVEDREVERFEEVTDETEEWNPSE